MSGGHYDYAFEKIEDLADKLSPSRDKYQPIRDRASKMLKLAAKISYDIEWIDSGDYGEESWKEVDDDLKKMNF